jgi:hypothetical protein
MDTEEGENDEGHHRSDDKAVRSTRAKARERYISRRGEESSEGDVEDEDVNEQGAGTNEALSYAAMMADEDIPEDVRRTAYRLLMYVLLHISLLLYRIIICHA